MGALAVELSIPSCCASEKVDKKTRMRRVESIVRCGVVLHRFGALLCDDLSCSGSGPQGKQLKLPLSDDLRTLEYYWLLLANGSMRQFPPVALTSLIIV
jgi:hypothetical protein